MVHLKNRLLYRIQISYIPALFIFLRSFSIDIVPTLFDVILRIM